MARVKRGVTTHARHKKVLEQVKGQRGRRSTMHPTARQSMEKALQYAYRDRRVTQARVPRPVDPAHQRARAASTG